MGRPSQSEIKKQRVLTHEKAIEKSSPNISLLLNLVNDPNIALEDKLERLNVVYAKYKYKDKTEVFEGLELIFR